MTCSIRSVSFHTTLSHSKLCGEIKLVIFSMYTFSPLFVQVLNHKKKGKKKKYINSGTVSTGWAFHCSSIICFIDRIHCQCDMSYALKVLLWPSLSLPSLFSLALFLFLLISLSLYPPPSLSLSHCFSPLSPYFSPLSFSSSLPPLKVTLLSFKVESEYTFVDFIRGGWAKSLWRPINIRGYS